MWVLLVGGASIVGLAVIGVIPHHVWPIGQVLLTLGCTLGVCRVIKAQHMQVRQAYELGRESVTLLESRRN